ncbi:methionyl-tRNA formyltransferase [Winogradskyella sp. PC-19]|uniref:methionyl-tRNA formyltransferase n=1 Tax=unclassified Winogradskyella TaxID=2615021 RepID=UPI000B3D08D5|nr:MULTISPECIES: methionyl-tRNA formyltransferase [unclassified Winogradskyella]ARV08219.1 methionyl-tRNA formyltransferase [Winogradskyella sp. PC-19]RZN74986.1 MAG: methionyl-tRNA formyltransferase [Winogradskyella sp.]
MTKKRDLRIVFMGTPDFAVATLKNLLDHNYNVVSVITAPDRPAGRGRKLKSSAVKEFALANDLKIMQPTNLKSEEFIEELTSLKANLQIIVAFRMLPKVVWDMPEYGTFNLHASLLPNYRGAAPIHWAIINGEEKTGVTTFFIDEKIDTGAIIMKKETDVAKDATVGKLHDKLMDIGSDLVIKTVRLIENDKVETTIQPKSEDLKTAYKLNRDNCKIDWNQNLDLIYNKIRGLNPFPTAWCYLNNAEDEKISVKVYGVSKIEELHNYENGTIKISDNEIKVACKNGFINIKELQLPNKRKMDAKSLLNGFEFNKNAKML